MKITPWLIIQAELLEKLHQRKEAEPDMKHACGIQEFNAKFWL